ncbi:MAG: DUF484 family protein [Cellvibrionaceae bacterium]
MTDQNTSTALTAADIAEYLHQHPDFFLQHQDLLGELTLPHESGEAVSLVERQVAVLRDRNMDLRHRLNKLLDTARDNDRLFDKTKRLVLALLEAENLPAAVNALNRSLNQDYGIKHYSLVLFGDPLQVAPSSARIVPISEARPYVGNLLKANRAVCGTLRDLEVELLFSESAPLIASAAAVPLNHNSTFGILAIGNEDPDYYRSSMGTLFLSYIGEVLNRVLPRLLNQ